MLIFCSSELEESDLHSESNKNYGEFVEHPFSWEFELPPSIMLSSNCAAYDRGNVYYIILQFV